MTTDAATHDHSDDHGEKRLRALWEAMTEDQRNEVREVLLGDDMPAFMDGWPPPEVCLSTALEDVLQQFRSRIHRDVMGQLKSVVARLAETHRSGITWASRLSSPDTLQAVVIQASSGKVRESVGVNGPGIVPRVARTRLSYATGDVQHDPFYKEFVEGVHSEQAVPIVAVNEERQEVLLAVVNQESIQYAQHHPASAELLRQKATAELAPLLHELEAVESSESFPCAWNPRRHGWGLRGYLTTILLHVKEELEHLGLIQIGMNDLHMTVWYVDLDDHALSPVASTGFSDGASYSESLRFDEAGDLGRLATAADWKAGTWRPRTGNGETYCTIREVMGTQGSRFIVSPELCGPKGVAPFRIIVQVTAFTPMAAAMLPGDAELHRFSLRIHEQVKGYLTLYPRFAADEVRRIMHICNSFSEQWNSVAETIETVLRADAVTIYVRPWKDKENLHFIAATAPLKQSDGRSLSSLDPDTRPLLSLVPAPPSHTVGNRSSYAGTLAGKPDKILRRTSLRVSGDRLEREGFNRHPSSDYSASLTRTGEVDPRFLGYALPNKKGCPEAIAVAHVMRPADRSPFKAWDAAALAGMLHAASPMIQSWRDWSAIRIPEAQTIIEETRNKIATMLRGCAQAINCGDFPPDDLFHGLHDLLEDKGISQVFFRAGLGDRLTCADTVSRRLRDPIPRSESLAALTRGVAVDAYERARAEFEGSWIHVVQAAVLMEARLDDRSLMDPIAYYHKDNNRTPDADTPYDPRRLRIPELSDDWRRFLDEGVAREFCGEPVTEGPITAGVRIPFLTWIGCQATRGVLSLDLALRPPHGLSGVFRDDLMLLGRRLATAWTVANSPIPRGLFLSRTQPETFAKELCRELHADMLGFRFGVGTDSRGPWVSPRIAATTWLELEEADWQRPSIRFARYDRPDEIGADPDADLWGVQEAYDEHSIMLRICLRFGMVSIGHVIARWTGRARDRYLADPVITRGLWVRSILAAASLWTWSWTEDRDDALVFIEILERDGIWTAQPCFQRIETPHVAVDRQASAQRTRELVHLS